MHRCDGYERPDETQYEQYGPAVYPDLRHASSDPEIRSDEPWRMVGEDWRKDRVGNGGVLEAVRHCRRCFRRDMILDALSYIEYIEEGH